MAKKKEIVMADENQTTIQRVWEVIFSTVFESQRRRILLSTIPAMADEVELSTGDNIVMAIDRLVRPEWWKEIDKRN